MTKTSKPFDLVIIGGAVSGATMAFRMARAGWKVAVVERASYPRRKVCGEFLSATNRPLFQDLGIGSDLLAMAGPPVDSVALYHGNGIVISAMPKVSCCDSLGGIALGRDVLDDYLLNKAREFGAEVYEPVKVSKINRQRKALSVTIESASTGTDSTGTVCSQELTAPVVVAAHGSWGASDLPTFPEFSKPSAKDLFGFKAHFSHATLPKGLMPLFVFPGGYGGLVETGAGRVSFSCCVRRGELSAIREQNKATSNAPGEAVVVHLCNTIRGIRETLEGAKVDGAILSTGPIRPGIRKAYEHGVFRVGNACGEAHPIIAEGITMAMQSSWILSEEWIAAGKHGDPDKVAKKYQCRWNRSFKGRIRASFLFAGMAMNPAITDSLHHLFKAFPRLLTYGAEISGKAKVVIPSVSTVA